MSDFVRALAALILALAVGSPARAWRDTAGGARAAGLALAVFEARLAANPSATQVLGTWCAEHAMASPPVIRAERDVTVDRPADADVRRMLGAGPGETVRYRRVRLACGLHVLSEADNWYLPRLLTAEMNRQLGETDRPFGLVVRSLKFTRRTLEVKTLLRAAARGTARALVLPHNVSRHRALLLDGEGRPFSLVVETYTDAVLDFAPVSR